MSAVEQYILSIELLDLYIISRSRGIYFSFRKVKCHALDYKHKLFETNKDDIPDNNLPRLVFMCGNNHMYPVLDEERRETTFKTSSQIGGKRNQYRAQQTHRTQHGGWNRTSTIYIYIYIYIYTCITRICPCMDY